VESVIVPTPSSTVRPPSSVPEGQHAYNRKAKDRISPGLPLTLKANDPEPRPIDSVIVVGRKTDGDDSKIAGDSPELRSSTGNPLGPESSKIAGNSPELRSFIGNPPGPESSKIAGNSPELRYLAGNPPAAEGSKNAGNSPEPRSFIEHPPDPEAFDSDDSDVIDSDSEPPVTTEEYHVYISEFITKNNLTAFHDPNDPRVHELALNAANKAEKITTEFGLSPELTPKLTKLALYDFVILCGRGPPFPFLCNHCIPPWTAAKPQIDDSSSMQCEQRIPALKDTLKRVAEIATILEPSGIAVRFLNYNSDRKFDNLVSIEDIQAKVEAVKFEGCTKLGTVLDRKIVQPMIIRKAISKSFEKPVIVVIITDGEVSITDTMKHLKGFLFFSPDTLLREDSHMFGPL
jgi:hypothetical protein